MKPNIAIVNKLAIPRGGGKTGALIRGTNWTDTSLGKPDNWPKELFTSLGILLKSPIPLMLFWGQDYVCFCNDSYISVHGNDPDRPVIGKKAKDVLPDSWFTLSKSIEQVLKRGASVLHEDRRFSLSPVFGVEGNISGVFVYLQKSVKWIK